MTFAGTFQSHLLDTHYTILQYLLFHFSHCEVDWPSGLIWVFPVCQSPQGSAASLTMLIRTDSISVLFSCAVDCPVSSIQVCVQKNYKHIASHESIFLSQLHFQLSQQDYDQLNVLYITCVSWLYKLALCCVCATIRNKGLPSQGSQLHRIGI